MRNDKTPARVLTIAGSDSGGGAGIQADIKTIQALGGYAMTAITAITVQDTVRVHGVHAVPPDIVAQQIRVVLDDIGADAIKTGMLVSAGIVNAVANELTRFLTLPLREGRNREALRNDFGEGTRQPLPSPNDFASRNRSTLPQGEGAIPLLVIDTVMLAKGGQALLDDAGVAAMKARLFPMATLITPNALEAAVLTGRAIDSLDDMIAAAKSLREAGVKNVLVKGGHVAGDTVTDVLAGEDGVHLFQARRLGNPATHGTGCTLASAIATGLAQGLTLHDAVTRGRAFVRDGISGGLALGHGTGPLGIG